MIRIVREEEPSKPSTRLSADASAPSKAAVRQTEPRKLATLLRGELDWIVMKCLEKQRERRYETANALVRDIQRFLADEAVEARPPSVSYRVRKLVHRNRAGVLTATAFAVLLVAGAAVSLWQAVVATRAEKEANIQRGAADRARDAEATARKEALRRLGASISSAPRMHSRRGKSAPVCSVW